MKSMNPGATGLSADFKELRFAFTEDGQAWRRELKQLGDHLQARRRTMEEIMRVNEYHRWRRRAQGMDW